MALIPVNTHLLRPPSGREHPQLSGRYHRRHCFGSKAQRNETCAPYGCLAPHHSQRTTQKAEFHGNYTPISVEDSLRATARVQRVCRLASGDRNPNPGLVPQFPRIRRPKPPFQHARQSFSTGRQCRAFMRECLLSIHLAITAPGGVSAASVSRKRTC